MRRLFYILLVVFPVLSLMLPAFSYAEGTQYFYDELGRLTRAVSVIGGVVIYDYDDVGNLLSISRQTANKLPPILRSISPDIVFAGTTALVTISGENLITTISVISDNSGIIINSFKSTDTAITANISLARIVAVGDLVLSIVTAYGTADIHLTILRVDLSPNNSAISVGQASDIKVGITPPRDLTFSIKNETPEIINAPSAITTTEGSGEFTVNGIGEGIGVIEIEGAGATISVTPAFAGDASISSQSVCVAMPVIINDAQSNQVSVQFNPVTGGVTSSPVSVQINPVIGNISSRPVSAQFSATDAFIVSRSVSVQISNE